MIYFEIMAAKLRKFFLFHAHANVKLDEILLRESLSCGKFSQQPFFANQQSASSSEHKNAMLLGGNFIDWEVKCHFWPCLHAVEALLLGHNNLASRAFLHCFHRKETIRESARNPICRAIIWFTTTCENARSFGIWRPSDDCWISRKLWRSDSEFIWKNMVTLHLEFGGFADF